MQGFTQDRWLTFNQTKKAGGYIRKGEHSTLAVLYKPMEREEQTESGQPVLDENGQPKVAHFGILRTHFLFNIEQTERLETLDETSLETEPSDPFFPSRPGYAFEELIAEMGAAFLCAYAGIRRELRHEGYIDSWLGLLKADNRAIFRASGQARCASEYVLNLEQQRKQTVMDDSRCMNDGA